VLAVLSKAGLAPVLRAGSAARERLSVAIGAGANPARAGCLLLLVATV